MSELWLPATVAAAAVTFTYFFCVRPMRRGQCAMTSPAAENRLDKELTEAQRVLAQMRADQHASDKTAGDPAGRAVQRSTATTDR